MKEIIAQIRAELISIADPVIQDSARRYFREEVKIYGIKNPVVKTITQKTLKKIGDADKKKIFEICDELWQSGYIEEGIMASEIAYSQRKRFEKSDFKIFENWVQLHINNWACCDAFCNHTVGDFLMQYPEFVKELYTWAKSPNRWKRRAAAVSLIVPARKGMYLEESLKVAGILLEDKDDLVQKGYGWLLKTAAEANQEPIAEFILMNKGKMPRTALRYSIEKMPPEIKERAMSK